ncbi:unnamed protein product [Rangifer tarandus platyrhynchus]|uniref:Uncharacterized protein n=1 Tax=Rangifer tarandus platyrhynchus TaxID=3082113 RepID=A0ABN8YZI1_RANTA|nr:unnamed protein product [Rangifer tarandus platyrhynchus]
MVVSPCRRRAPGSPRERGEVGGGGGVLLPPVLQHHRRPRRGSGERLSSLPDICPAASLSERCSCALRRLSPPPALLRRQPPLPPAPRLPLDAPSPWKFPRRPGPLARPGLLLLACQDPRSPPLPEKKRTRSHQRAHTLAGPRARAHEEVLAPRGPPPRLRSAEKGAAASRCEGGWWPSEPTSGRDNALEARSPSRPIIRQGRLFLDVFLAPPTSLSQPRP